jgi:hypothetical protein
MKLSLDYLVRKGLRRGLVGGETLWLVLGGSALALRLGLRVIRKRDEVVFSEKLGIGESIIITHRSPEGHNGRRESPAAEPQAGS